MKSLYVGMRGHARVGASRGLLGSNKPHWTSVGIRFGRKGVRRAGENFDRKKNIGAIYTWIDYNYPRVN